MRRNKKRKYWIRKTKIEKDKEGNTIKGYQDEVIETLINIWPASGQMQAQIYGNRLPYIFNGIISKDSQIKENDGVFSNENDEKPKYRIISIKEYTKHCLVELEQL